MRRLLVAFRIARLYFLVKRKWLTLDPERFHDWLKAERHQAEQLSSPELSFFSVWIARFSGRVHPKYACVLASCTVYLLAPSPVKLYFGVQREERFSAHAWAQWPGGSMQMDAQRKYETLWEISS